MDIVIEDVARLYLKMLLCCIWMSTFFTAVSVSTVKSSCEISEGVLCKFLSSERAAMEF